MAALGLGISDRAGQGAPEGLSLDFGGDRHWVGRRRLGGPTAAPGWRFTRDGGAWSDADDGSLIRVEADVPRIGTGGLLLEGSATNLITRSTEFAHGDWMPIFAGTGVAPVVSNDPVAAPDGSLTGVEVVFDRGPGDTPSDLSMILHSDFPTEIGAGFSASLWARAETPCRLLMRHVGANEYLTLTVDERWRRFTMPSQAALPASAFQIGCRGGYGADAAVRVQIWNAQCEPGAATSDIVSGATPGVRAADVLNLDHDPADRGTLSVEFTLPWVQGSQTLAACDGEALLALNAGVLTCQAGGGSLVMPGAVAPGRRTRAAITWEPGRRAMTRDGLTPVGDASAPQPGGLELGACLGVAALNGRLGAVQRLDRAVSDAALAAMTV